MLFNSPVYLFLFLPAALAGYYAARRFAGLGAAIIVLLAASLFFYGYWNPVYLILLLGSILVNFFLAGRITRADKPRRKALLIAAVGFNLILLGVFKYAGFLIDSADLIAPGDWPSTAIILPLAISFFTFQQIAYQVDAYKGLVEPSGLPRYALFVFFFPQLIAGPIVHHKEMMPQFGAEPERGETLTNFQIGLFILIAGLFKKVVLADGAAQYATPVFDMAERGREVELFSAWAGALCYTGQIYFDFSGYSDMAVGAARLFGVRLPTNFFSPYKATSIADFWRRWHITLSRFLRDYLYIPLGGNRRGNARRYANLMITMVLGGLWHGAGWTFVFWGFLHGLYLVVNHAWDAIKRRAPAVAAGERTAPRTLAAWAVTMLAVIVAWVIFRAETFGGAANILRGMAGLNGAVFHPSVAYMFGQPHAETLLGIAVGPQGMISLDIVPAYVYGLALLMIAALTPNVYQITRRYGPTVDYGQYGGKTRAPAFHPTMVWGLVTGAAAMLALAKVLSAAPSEFLYFRF